MIDPVFPEALMPQGSLRVVENVLFGLKEALPEHEGDLGHLTVQLLFHKLDLRQEMLVVVVHRGRLERVEDLLIDGDIAKLLHLLALMSVRRPEVLQHMLAHLQFFQLHVVLDGPHVILVNLGE